MKSRQTAPRTHPVQLHVSQKDHLRDWITVRNTLHTWLPNKPQPGTGLWTSTWNEQTHSSAWTEWCQFNSEFLAPHWFLLTPQADARIYTIDTLDDLLALLEVFSLPGVSQTILQVYGGLLDCERLAGVYDGIHLTEAGQWATRLTTPSLYGWDCESTLWLRWCFSSVQKVKAGVFEERQD